MKALDGKSYGSIPHLSISKLNQQADKKVSEGEERILTVKTRDKYDFVIVTEKVDGTNIGVAKIYNNIVPVVRAGYDVLSSEYRHIRLFQDFVDQNFKRFNELLENGERICGEWMTKTMSLKYDVPHEPFISFDIFDINNKRILYNNFIERCKKFDIITAGLVSIGGPISISKAMLKLGGRGHHGCLETPEGVVYRCERKGRVEFLAKYVREHKIDGLLMDDDKEWNTWKNYNIINNY